MLFLFLVSQNIIHRIYKFYTNINNNEKKRQTKGLYLSGEKEKSKTTVCNREKHVEELPFFQNKNKKKFRRKKVSK